MVWQGKKISNAQQALAAGFVGVEPGVRGRTLVDASAVNYGTAPAAIVDLKAALRWLRHNTGGVPGNMNQIISCGTSPGGALSTLLGATGDRLGLQTLGAAETSDAVFATAAWCPITGLEHADMAFEWNWGSNPGLPGDPAFAMGNTIAATGIDAALSADLAALCPGDQSSLGLKGQGDHGPLTAETYGAYLTETLLRPEAPAFLAKMSENDRTAYLAAHPNIAWDGTQAQPTRANLLSHVGSRKTNVPAFDALDGSSGENNFFGAATSQARHFTAFTQQQITGGPDLAPDLVATVALMNPMPALAQANPARSRHWWFRLGAKDSDTSLTVVGNLGAQTRAHGDTVNTRYHWDAGHGANEDVGVFIAWIAATTGYAKLWRKGSAGCQRRFSVWPTQNATTRRAARRGRRAATLFNTPTTTTRRPLVAATHPAAATDAAEDSARRMISVLCSASSGAKNCVALAPGHTVVSVA